MSLTKIRNCQFVGSCKIVCTLAIKYYNLEWYKEFLLGFFLKADNNSLETHIFVLLMNLGRNWLEISF